MLLLVIWKANADSESQYFQFTVLSFFLKKENKFGQNVEKRAEEISFAIHFHKYWNAFVRAPFHAEVI